MNESSVTRAVSKCLGRMGETAVKGHRSGLPACVLRPLDGVQHAGMLTFPDRNSRTLKLAVGWL